MNSSDNEKNEFAKMQFILKQLKHNSNPRSVKTQGQLRLRPIIGKSPSSTNFSQVTSIMSQLLLVLTNRTLPQV